MQIDFRIDNAVVTFSRNWFAGRAALAIDGKVIRLQSPWNPSTHVSFSLSKLWTADIAHHMVTIEKTRPLVLAGFRPQIYRISVDGQLLVEKAGY